MARKILVTGAAGLIGREICKRLSIHHHVIGIDNNFRYPDFVPDGNYFKMDVMHFLNNAENDFDFIFHMSAINGTKHFYEMPNKVIRNNVSSDLSVFSFVEKNPNCKLIYASSSEVVADTDIFPTSEIVDIQIKNIHNPRWSYRLGKILAENYLKNSDLNFLIIRFYNVFGTASGQGHFVRDIIDKLKIGDTTILGADETRSFCRVEDAVDALLNIYDRCSGEVINIGSDEEITVLEASSIIADHMRQKIEWELLPGKEGSVKRRKPSLNKLLSYYPEYNPQKFANGVKDL